MVRTNLQEFGGDVHVLSNLQVGSNLFANDLAANVLTVDGSIGSTFFIGDGGLLSNIATTLNDIVANPGGNAVSNTLVFESGADATSNTAIVTLSNVGISISNTEPTGEFQFAVGSNIFVNTHASNVLTVVGAIGSDLFIGDGGLLSNIATTLDQIVDQGNTVSNTLIFESGIDATSNAGIVTKKDVGISVSNTEPTGEFQFGVGSNLLVNVYSSNVLAIEGNVSAEKMTLGTITVTSAYGLNHVTAQGSVTGDTISLTNATTGLTADSNIVVGGNVTAETVITSANVEVGDRLKFASNVFVDDLRVADVAANLVTYDKTTGELMDSGGLFANKLAVVSVQPPSALSANTTTIAKHGTYTVTTSGLESTSNAWNAFDGDSAVEWKSIFVNGRLYDAGGIYTGSTRLATTTKEGEWLAIEFPYKTTLRHMKLTPPTTYQQYPASANVYATNDSLTWTELTNWSGVDPGDQQSNVQTIIVNATEPFKKYAMVVTKTNEGTDNTALAEWKLFAESFSIDGGQISMAQQPVTGGETTMEQSGPHSRDPTTPLLKKFPEIAFEEGKFDRNDSTNTYVQAGYTVTASSTYSTYSGWKVFDGVSNVDTKSWYSGDNLYSGGTPVGTGSGSSKLDTNVDVGEYLVITLPFKIKASYAIVSPRTNGNYSPKSGKFYGYDGNSWIELSAFTNKTYTPGSFTKIDIDSTTFYEKFAIVSTEIAATTSTYTAIGELQLYGYEEDPPAGDTSVDTTFTSIMNTPQTTGANVYVDGNLGETFTNRVTGPDATGPSATYDATGKYWELNGSLESNIAVEANTFLSGDQPHAVSVWFNSSNLEANVSNTCVFSVSDQEHLNSENLDLQSNTWHNLTYAYQGEGGSRVTYLDGRKVAEDQAEDTFGEYPPFAMTGNSQGGYVVSASSLRPSHQAWHAFDKTKYAAGVGEKWASEASQGDTFTGGNSLYDGTNRLSSSTPYGAWLKIELPHKIRLQYISLFSDPTTEQPKDFIIYGSNDDNTWDQLFQKTGATENADYVNYTINSVSCYKYFGLVIRRLISSTTIAAIDEWKLYGHRENDLVRLPDPTNVLKYPHIAMTGPAQRGYVVSASTSIFQDYGYETWGIFSNGAKSGWHTGEAENEGGNTFKGTNFAYEVVSPYSPRRMAPETPQGEFLKLTLPNRIILNYITLTAAGSASSRSAEDFEFWGSDTGVDGSWNFIKSFTGESQLDTGTNYVINATTLYKHIGLIITRCVNSESLLLKDLKLYGTEENSSVPIQIGGGNIDKVANFRVYDKFIGEDQALEIWDAQKDAFGRAKSSMTLQKGRLGIGTTEPQGRLAVLDEPNGLEEFPPRPMTGYKNYFEGHGEFCVYASSEGSATRAIWKAFNKVSSSGDWWEDANYPSYTNGVYNGAGSYSLGGISGQYVIFELPYKIDLKSIGIAPRTNLGGRSPGTGVILGSNDRTNWEQIHSFSGLTYTNDTFTNININTTKKFSVFAMVVTNVAGSEANTGLQLSEMKFFGTREQGQSVLHDGQLTLTKSLNVPRIGPALDADDTPRRDRLVVEYNTSTNPTFEGAVRDTSGRGNDGVYFGSASYSAADKAFSTPNSSGITVTGSSLGSGAQPLTLCAWAKGNIWDVNDNDCVIGVGPNSSSGHSSFQLCVNTTHITLDMATSTNYLEFPTTLTNGRWYFIAMTYTGGDAFTNTRVYVDGVEIAKPASWTNGTSATLSLPSNPDIGVATRASKNGFLNGYVSNPKVYNVALEPSEVKTLYDMGRNGSVANPQPLHIAAPLYAPGTIVQVEQSIKTDTFSTTGATSHPVSPGNDVPGLAVTIHPKFANSKILVSYTVSTGAYGRAYLRIQRKQGGSTTTIAPSVGVPNSTDGKCTTSHSGSGDSSVDSQSFEYYDTIGGTEPITYQIQAWTYHSVYYIYVNRGHNDGDGGSGGTYWARTLSSITAKEVCQ
jgi:hypothetical protein